MINVYEAGKNFLRGAYTQYTPTGKSLFIRAGKYGKIPHKGDIVYFYNKNLGRVAHVGAVVEVSQKDMEYTIKVVEGNTSGQNFERNGGEVAIKIYRFTISDIGNGKRIDGFGTPRFAEDTTSVDFFVKVLKDEIGYMEKASPKQLESKKENIGNKNFTKYGEWYKNNGVYWCQQFISWCAYESCRQYQKREIPLTGWIKINEDWYYKKDGVHVCGQWLEINDKWYVFDEAGRAIRGWFKSAELWYYMNQDCMMISKQWLEIDEKYYYFDENGVMVKSAYVKNESGVYNWIGNDGTWQKE